MKKAIALILVLLMTLALFTACGTDGGTPATEGTVSSDSPMETDTSETSEGSKGDEAAMDILAQIVNDGDATKITDAAFNGHFNGSALEGVKTLLAEGKAFVNGIAVPSAEGDTDDYQVNGVSSLYKTSSGWGYNVHKTTSADNLSFEEARLGFFETITTVRGHITTIYGDAATGLVNKIDTQSYDVFRITYFEDHGGMVDKFDRGDFELETQRVRPDVNLVTVSSDHFDDDIIIGDFVIYYYGPDGWIMEKAVGIQGTLSKNDNGEFVVNAGTANEYVHIESNISRYNLIDCNRPSQFFNAYNRLGMQEVEVVTWCTPTGHPIGFTYGDKTAAKEALGIAIENATAAKDGVVVSADGSGVPVGTMWAAQEDFDAYDAAIAAAEVVYAKNGTAVQEYDAAIYALALALGEGGEKPSGFIGAQGEGA